MHEYVQDDLIFSWNEFKAEINERKHGVTFEEAATAFKDINAKIYDDDEHSDEEERFILLGKGVIMKAHYDLKNPRKNPFAERMKKGYRIVIDREPIEDDELEEIEFEEVEQDITEIPRRGVV